MYVWWVGSSAVGVLSLALASSGCGGESEAPNSGDQADPGRWTIEDARAFDEFPLYWLGESSHDLPVTEILRYKYDGQRGGSAENIVLFVYGTCDPGGGGDGGCAPPISVRVEPYCDKPPGFAETESGPDIDVRGALGRRVAEHVQVWTGNVTVGVFPDGGQELAVGLAQDLRPLSDDGSGELGELPPPRSEPCPYAPPTPRLPSS